MAKHTKSDIENYHKLPENKWFELMDVWPAVKRTHYSLSRLIQHGYVESKIETSQGIHTRYYRKLNPTQS